VIRHAVHPGVRVDSGQAVDAARGVTLDTRSAAGDPDRVAASLIAAGCAQLEHDAAERIRLLLDAVRRRSLAPARAVRLGFTRRYAQGGVPTVIWEVLMAARLPVAVMVVGIGGVALLAGLLAGDPATPLRAGAWGVLVCAVSMVCHESAHLLTLRALARDRALGAIEHSWVNVWIVGPVRGGGRRRLTALAGPLAGVVACAALGIAGVEAWICWAVAVAHAANLFPLAPDGRAVFGR
jgi:hypothetical protein